MSLIDKIRAPVIMAFLGWTWFEYFYKPFNSSLDSGETQMAVTDASQTVMQSFVGMIELFALAIGGIFAAALFIAVIPALLGAIVGLVGTVYYRKRWPVSTFGRRKQHRTKDSVASDNRCVNCFGEIEGHSGVRNIGTENTVLFGFDVLEHERVETVECSECHQADWFEHAMRADKHEEDMFDPDALTDDTEEPESDSEQEDEETGAINCPACGKECKNEHGLRVHWGSVHPESDIDNYPHSIERATRDIPDSDRVEEYREAHN